MMPADIEAMFSVRKVPWHREGEVLEDYPQNFEEARKKAGLAWDPVAYPAVTELSMTRADFRRHALEILAREEAPTSEAADTLADLWEASFTNTPVSGEVTGTMRLNGLVGTLVNARPKEQWFRIARDDTGATLSYQRDSYNVIPNSAFGDIIDAIIGAEKDTVKLETGGSLAGGKKVWMLARLDEPHQVQAGGRIDKSYSFPYLGLTTDHTGKASCCARLTQVRIVCGNTFAAAEAEGEQTGAVFTFSHRGDWRERIDEAREALQFARRESAAYIAAMSDLLGITVTPQQQKLWLAEFLPVPPEGATDRAMANIEEARTMVQGFLDGPTVEGAGIGGTAYGLVQAAGEWADHGRRSLSWESKFTRSMLKSEPLKAKAAVLAREVASA